MKELSLEEAALAWAQGKRVEATNAAGVGEFYPIGIIGIGGGHWTPLVFDIGSKHRFRLAPELPAKKFRKWMRDEVPIGAIIKAKERTWRSLIVGVTQLGDIQIHDGRFDTEFALENHVHSIDPVGTPDDKRTWLPCGVEVDA